jgi:hypothetical protein
MYKNLVNAKPSPDPCDVRNAPDQLLLDDGIHGLHLGILNDGCDLHLLDAVSDRHQLACTATWGQLNHMGSCDTSFLYGFETQGLPILRSSAIWAAAVGSTLHPCVDLPHGGFTYPGKCRHIRRWDRYPCIPV